MRYLVSIIFFFNLGFTQSFGEKLVTIITEPKGAEVYLNGKSIGVSPCTTRLKNGLITPKQMVRIELNGYKTSLGELNQKINPTFGCIGLGIGIVTGIGFISLIWATEFDDSYHFYLQPIISKKPSKYDAVTGEIEKN